MLRFTMLATTPGCGMSAMSGASFAWILVMIRLLMSVTFDILSVIPASLAFAVMSFLRPSKTGWSTLIQISTVLSSLLLPPPPQAARPLTPSAMAATAVRALTPRLWTRMCSP